MSGWAGFSFYLKSPIAKNQAGVYNKSDKIPHGGKGMSSCAVYNKQYLD